MNLIRILLISAIFFLFGTCKEEEDDSDLLLGALFAFLGTGESKVSTPVFKPAAGNQTSLSNIEISTTTPDATIHYTLDGSTPTSSSDKYSSPIKNTWILAGKTIQAIAIKSGLNDSDTLTGVFSYPPLKTGSGDIPGYTKVSGEDADSKLGIERGYSDNGDGTVTDKATGLIWQKCTKGSNSSTDCTGVTTDDRSNLAGARNYCSSLSLASKTWRLPSRQELETLVDYGLTASPVIDGSVFPETVANPYWSSTNYLQQSTSAWLVSFSLGDLTASGAALSYYVRCVSTQ
ncbi:Lcl domain-containing protein [Leptospira sp. GIMC2001]|uniref:Lcl domain-containing protein n=1 Tax=Leptospira sp. GIMC2001 TaxID=1513297 RepID=UPI0023491156|nr:DUF1566 domain-containing protein [Leptospira sp. GIMC2001]WCL49701.1 DUF1566 domain-containing protein [Leptospira sp. GIMC2001]